jgi:tetratricopeptide (TPR) repeat protein
MDAKLRSTLSKIEQERSRGNHTRAAKRAADALRKFPESAELYVAAIDANLEAGESLEAIQLLKRGLKKLPGQRAEIVAAARERAGSLGDGAMGKFLLEDSVRRRDLRDARAVVGDFPDRIVRDLLQRTRMKRNSLASAARGGHAVDEEMMTNVIGEAVLCARLGRAEEAAAAATLALERNRADSESLAPLLEDVAQEHPQSAHTLLGLARCLAASSLQNAAIDRVLEAVRIDPELGAHALQALREFGEGMGETPASIDRAVIEVLLITGDHQRAAEKLGPWLEEGSESAHQVVDVAFAHVADAGPVSDLHLLVLDAAASAGRDDSLHHILESLEQDRDNHPQLLEWFDSRDETSELPASVLLVHARLLIEAGRYDDAGGTLKAVCLTSRSETDRVAALVSDHRDKSQTLDTLYAEITSADEVDGEGTGGGSADAPLSVAPVDGSAADDIEVLEPNQFQFSASSDDDGEFLEAEDEPGPIGAGQADGDEEFDIYDGNNILGTNAGAERPTGLKPSSYTGARRPLDNDRAGIIWDEEGDDSGPAPSEPEIDESYVRDVADSLYESGAATFFHIDDGTTDPVETTAEQDKAATPLEETPSADEAPAADETPPAQGFEARLARLRDGDLAVDDALDLMEEADDDGRTVELGEIIRLTPPGARRALCEAEYELSQGRPARALENLRALRDGDLSEEQRKNMWLKTVACQRMMQDLDAAHRTLVQLVSLYPDCPDVDRLARLNYREYLEIQCADAPALEKVTSLDEDA